VVHLSPKKPLIEEKPKTENIPEPVEIVEVIKEAPINPQENEIDQLVSLSISEISPHFM